MKPCVLILDDEAAIVRTLSRTLRHAGFDVVACEDSEKAAEALETRDVAVIVCDQRMPVVDGVTFLERAAHRYPDTVRILLTGFADAQVAADAVNRASVFRLLWKPWADGEILEAVRQAAWLHGLASDEERTPPVSLDPPLKS